MSPDVRATHAVEETGNRRTSVVIALLLFAAVGLCLAAWWSLYLAPNVDNFIAAPLRSVLVANYGADPLSTRGVAIDISLVGDLIGDQTGTPGVDRQATLASVLQTPVVTITASGGVVTSTPSPTSSPTATPSATPNAAASALALTEFANTATATETLEQSATASDAPTAIASETAAPATTDTPAPPTEPPPTNTAPPAPTDTQPPAPSDTPVPPPADTPIPPPTNTPVLPPTNTPNAYPPPASPTNTPAASPTNQSPPPTPSNTPPPTNYP